MRGLSSKALRDYSRLNKSCDSGGLPFMAAEEAKGADNLPDGCEGIAALMVTITDALNQADRLNLPMVAIHLDHALALCRKALSDGDDG